MRSGSSRAQVRQRKMLCLPRPSNQKNRGHSHTSREEVWMRIGKMELEGAKRGISKDAFLIFE